jgi:hypothetical protein
MNASVFNSPKSRFVAILFTLIGLATALSASDTALDRETLRGLKSIYVVVSVPSNEALQGDRIQADVADRLRLAGIAVRDLNLETLSLPCLFVSATLLKRPDGLVAYAISVSLNQAVTVIATNRSYMAPTWSANTLAVASGSDTQRFVRSDVVDLADKFISAYRSVNRRD